VVALKVEEANRLNDRLVQRAIRMEGTCTGEHGVGSGKKVHCSPPPWLL
jgi:D-lactate dehydrogenase (cytochrome)